MRAIEVQLSEGRVQLTLEARVYRLAAVKKTAYRLADRCTVVITHTDDQHHELDIQFKSSTSDERARETIRGFYQELLDQELREQVAEETTPIRALIMAHAFSKVDLIKRGE